MAEYLTNAAAPGTHDFVIEHAGIEISGSKHKTITIFREDGSNQVIELSEKDTVVARFRDGEGSSQH